MPRLHLTHDRPGVALALTIMVVLVVGAVSTAAAVLSSNTWLINHYDERQSILSAAADAGLEEARARINGNPDLFPDSGYALLENAAPAVDAGGDAIANVSRYTYVGPTGSATGQFGVFGNIVVVAEDGNGDRVIRRLEVLQESFAKFAYFTDVEGNIVFASGDVIQGPVHSNDEIEIHYSGATFKGPVTTAQTIVGVNNGTFEQGFTEHAARIPMPDLADLQELEGYATDANLVFTSPGGGGIGETGMRIEFVAADLNGDGDNADSNEGFIKVYEAPAFPWYVVADMPPDYNDQACLQWGQDWQGNPECDNWGNDEIGLANSPNCGHIGSHGEFLTASEHPNQDDWMASIANSGRCFLGGSDPLWAGDAFLASDSFGAWRQWPGASVAPVVAAARPDDGAYLFPISRALNPEFQGVIYIEGKVAVSGTVRGHVTLAATGDIIIADDIEYATDVGSPDRSCTDGEIANDDMLGLFSGGSIIVADNTLNTPTRPRPGNGYNYFSLDETPYEVIDATVLTLSEFTVEDYSTGPDNHEACGADNSGRGCLILNGGIIQGTRGAVGLVGGEGYIKRYAYDVCAAKSPPPYFPTTGHFSRSRYFNVDPVGFDPAGYFTF